MKPRSDRIQCLLLADFVLLHWSAVLLQRQVRKQNGLTELLAPIEAAVEIRGLQLVTAAEATSDMFSMMAPSSSPVENSAIFLVQRRSCAVGDDVDWREGGW
jgi:hypothetical protein